MTTDRPPRSSFARPPRTFVAFTTLATALAACVTSAPPGPPPPPAPAAPTESVASPSAPPPPPGSASPSASAPLASATASNGPPPLPPGACPAAVSKAPESPFKDDDSVPGPAELPIEDLDGDGVPEIVVSYAASYTERGILVVKKVAAPTCFEVLYQGVGEGAGGRKTKTKGFADLSVLMLPITSNGRGMAMAIGKWNGKRYRLERVEKCAGIDGKKLPTKECNTILAGYDDAARGGPP